MKGFVFFCTVVVAMCLLDVEGQSAQFYCGKKLADAWAYYCLYEEKQSANSVNQYQANKQPLEPTALQIGKRDGIVDECCFQPCDVQVLLSYC
ncbi:hypothetical protein K1T71_007475 [Dendrolimus kikuchii]|uniref:Uncharacterized protein n=1 Tax=Dendrolimus kikuchii TaxID=765133 RepID=A0ACC1D0J5_9NEOP|nr:hypothetical protein K1T71_007475 [Dendrolimus kikuchii]